MKQKYNLQHIIIATRHTGYSQYCIITLKYIIGTNARCTEHKQSAPLQIVTEISEHLYVQICISLFSDNLKRHQLLTLCAPSITINKFNKYQLELY
jgi:hypothetical protein